MNTIIETHVETLKSQIRVYGEWFLEIRGYEEYVNLEDDDWWSDTFLQDSVNGCSLYNFVEWYEVNGNSIDNIPVSFYTYMIRYINTYYTENFGEESVMDWKKITPNFIITNYAYVIMSENLEDWKEDWKKDWDLKAQKEVEEVETKPVSNEWVNEFHIGEDVLFRYSTYYWWLAKVQDINTQSITVELYAYDYIDDIHSMKHNTDGFQRLIWKDHLDTAMQPQIVDSRSIIAKRGQSKLIDQRFIMGKKSVSYDW